MTAQHLHILIFVGAMDESFEQTQALNFEEEEECETEEDINREHRPVSIAPDKENSDIFLISS